MADAAPIVAAQPDFYRVLYDVAQRLAETLDEDEIHRRVLDTLQTGFGFEYVSITRIDPETKKIYIVAHRTGQGVTAIRELEGIGNVGDYEIWERAWRDGTPFYSENVRIDTNLAADMKRFYASIGVKSLVAAPMVLSRTLGWIYAETYYQYRHFTQAEVDLLMGVARVAAQALRNAELYRALQNDIVERERAQEALRAQEQLATLGAFTRVLAHEIRNPLNAMQLAVDLSRKRLAKLGLGDDYEFLRATETLNAEIQRLDTLLEDYLTFSTGAILQRGWFDVDRLLDQVLKKYSLLFSAENVMTNFAPGAAGQIYGDSNKLEQVIHNVIKNAVEAMPQGGNLSIATISVETPQGRAVEIRFRDTGAGMADADKAFEPFFTTKPRGTGLGLAVVREIVRHHGGTVTIESKPGEGTTVKVAIPNADPGVAI